MEQKRPVRVALIGVAGYGAVHTRNFLEQQSRGAARIVAYCETAPERNPEGVARLHEAGAVGYTDYRAMLKEMPLDAVVISTPIPLHRPMLEAALAAGCHVLLEKPVAATLQDLYAMLDAQKRANRIVAVGFQHTALPGFRQLQALLRTGRIGKVRRVTGTGIWHRDDSYYARARWAGKLTLNGNWVLDGTIMNPLAHLVNVGLIAASPRFGRPARPAQVMAELYHVNPIESEDTSCVRILTEDGVEVLIYCTLGGNNGDGPPVLRVEGTAGTAVWTYDDTVLVTDASGRVEQVPIITTPDDIPSNFLAAVRGEALHLHAALEDSLCHLTAANGAFLSAWPPAPIPGSARRRIVNQRGNEAWIIEGISDTIAAAAERGQLYSELGVDWARAGRTLDVRNLKEFAPPLRLALITDEASPVVEEAVALGLEYGITEFELRNVWGSRVPDVTEAQVEALLALKAKHGLTYTALSPGTFKCGITSADVAPHLDERLPRTISLAERLGVSKIITFGFAREAGDPADAWDRCVDILRRAVATVEAAGMTLLVEPEAGFWVDTGAAAARVVRAVDSKAFLVNWDPGNCAKAGEVAYPDGYEAVRGLIGHVHLKDYSPAPCQWVAPGDGIIDWPGQMRALLTDRPVPYVTVETHFKPLLEGSRLVIERLLRYMKEA